MAANRERPRLQTDIGPAPERLRPVATPVDTFVRTKAGQTLAQLAEGLSAVAPALTRISDTVAQEQSAKQSEAGEQAARDAIAQNKTYLDAIKAGTMKPSDNPWYRLAFKEQYGRVAGSQYSAQLQTNLAQSDVAESTNPADFDKFEAQQRTDYIDKFGLGADPAVANAFGKTVDQLVAGHRSSFASAAASRMERDFGENLHQEVFQNVSVLSAMARTGVLLDPSAVAKSVQLSLDRAVAPGHNAGQANRTVVSAVVSAAQHMNDPEILKILDHVVTNNAGAKLSGTSYASTAIEQAENQIVGQQMAQWNHAQNVETQQQKKLVDDSKMSIMNQLITSGNASAVDLTEPLKALNKLDPGAVTDIIHARDALVSGLGRNDEEVIKDETASIWEGHGSRTRIIRLLGDGHINEQGFNLLNEQLLRSEEAGRSAANANSAAVGRIFNDPLFEEQKTLFESAFGNELGMDPESRNRKRNGTTALLQQWSDYAQKHPDASVDEKMKFLTTTTENLRRIYGSPNEISFANVPSIPGVSKDWRKESVVSPQFLSTLSQHVAAKAVTPAESAFLTSQGLTTPEQVGHFIEMQRTILHPSTTQSKK